METSRLSELTAVIQRDKFDEAPGDLTAPEDLARWHDYRVRYHRAHELAEHFDFPPQLDFELNSSCQMACRFCLHGVETVPKRLLPFEDFKRVIDEGKRYGLVSIKLNYINEPLLSKDLYRAIEYAKANGVLNVYFATNGLLLTPRVARRLIETRVSKIMISLDAVTPETFAEIRRSRGFDKIVQNILFLLYLRRSLNLSYPLVRVNFIRTPINDHEAERFIEIWREAADMIGFQDQVGIPGIENEMLDSNNGRKDLSNFRCSFPYKLLVIDSNGDILPCCTFGGKSLAIGNIRSITIKEAWDSRELETLKVIHKLGQYKTIPTCRHCVGASS